MTQSQILINHMSFNLPTGSLLFDELTLTFQCHKTGLVGRNGIGKSMLIKLILSELQAHRGAIQVDGCLAYVPQQLTVSTDISVAALLGCEEKIMALHHILQGSIDQNDYIILNDDWDIKERITQQLTAFGLGSISYQRQLKSLSGGEITRLLLAKAFFSQADFIILDEPTNHLDQSARLQLFQAVKQWQKGMIIASHDRSLLNLMDEIVELSTLGANSYGGNYDAYTEQKKLETLAKEQQLGDARKLLQHAKNSIQSSHEKHEQRQTYGRELRRSGRIDKMGADVKKGVSERTQSKLLIKEERLLDHAETKLQAIKDQIEIHEDIHIALPATYVPKGKIILDIEDLCFSYSNDHNKLIEHFNLKIQGAERIALLGDNGSGKTTLVKLILAELSPQVGTIQIGTQYLSYLDQNTSLLKANLSVLDNFLGINPDANENDAYRCLAQFLFRNASALKLVKDLSGGEKLRALLACVLLSKHPPQLLILDEPTNHLDLHSIHSIETALNHYQGAMIAISHDQRFLENIGVERVISAPFR